MKRAKPSRPQRPPLRRARNADAVWGCLVEYLQISGEGRCRRVANVRGTVEEVLSRLNGRSTAVHLLGIQPYTYRDWVGTRSLRLTMANALEAVLQAARVHEGQHPGELICTAAGPVELRRAIAFLEPKERKLKARQAARSGAPAQPRAQPKPTPNPLPLADREEDPFEIEEDEDESFISERGLA